MAADEITVASWGLLGAWIVHDLEELATASSASKDILALAPQGLPLPDELRGRGLSQRHFTIAVGIMALLMMAASAQGARTRGTSRFYRGVLLGFGLHGFGHLAGTAALRRYTPGVATSPAVVIPFWLWARRVLRRHGLTDVEPATVALAAMGPGLALAVHAGVNACLRRGLTG